MSCCGKYLGNYLSCHSCTFYFLFLPRNIPALMQVKHFVAQRLFSYELHCSSLILRLWQLQAVRNFVSKLKFQNFSNRFVIQMTPNQSRDTHSLPGLLINSAGNEVATKATLLLKVTFAPSEIKRILKKD